MHGRSTWKRAWSSSKDPIQKLLNWLGWPGKCMPWIFFATTMTTILLAWMYPRVFTACLWSLPTMNLYLVSREGLSYEEYHTLTYMWHHWLWQFWYVYELGTWCNPFIFLPSQLRPHGKFLVLSKDDDNNSRFLLGREVLLLMGLPINRMAGIEESSDKVLCMN